MNKLRKDAGSFFKGSDSDDEDRLYERQALIDDEELYNSNDNAVNPFGVRQRQNRNKSPGEYNNFEHELKSINKSRDDYPSEHIFYDIKPDDSLQSICLRFACSINQVKRLNSLINDQDFYGLRRIRLPLGKLSLLEDVLKKDSDNNNYVASNGFQTVLEATPSDSTLPLTPKHSDEDAKKHPIPSPTSIKIVNSPGSALSVSVARNTQFKPLLSPGCVSSDRIHDLDRDNRNQIKNSHLIAVNYNSNRMNHSHSFSSLREFNISNDNINIDIGGENQPHSSTVTTPNRQPLGHKTFIKFNLNDLYDENVETDDILEIGNGNVGRVFEDLDYHVERAKAAAECYDQRAAELVDKIEMDNRDMFSGLRSSAKKSKIPELFYCNENFGLSYQKLLIIIFIVCLVIPLVYFNQVESHLPAKQH